MASYLSKESPVFIEQKGIDLGILAVVDTVQGLSKVVSGTLEANPARDN